MSKTVHRPDLEGARMGLGIVSFDRPDILSNLLNNLDYFSWGGARTRLVVIDEPYSKDKYRNIKFQCDHEVLFKKRGGVGSAKNIVLNYMLSRGCEHIFIMEDDILLKSEKVCESYVHYAKGIGVPHLNFALHGPLNKGRGRWLTWSRGSKLDTIWVFPDCVGAFSYYTSEIIDVVGGFDENFFNAWEHVEHTWRISLTKRTPPFWYFMDHPESANLLQEIDSAIENSVIRSSSEHHSNIRKGRSYWVKKHLEFLPPRPRWL